MLVGQQIGPFAVDKEIGAGAMGTVYKARYTKTGQEVAIKIISAGLDTHSTTLARFEREAAILKTLDHPNIVRLFATGRYRATPFYVMEYIQGETLERLLERRGRFTWEEVVTLGQQISAALQHAHNLGVIHRDLKPANVMMTPDGTAKLTDFGIAKGIDNSKLTATNCAIGTAAYMSPEQCRGERNITPKSDLYSLGVLFYELLTGRLPFQADTTLDMFLAHTEGKFERPSRLVLDIPIWLDTLVTQLLEKEPEKRPFDAAMVGQSLARVLEKVAAQRSAGVDAVGSTVVDRPRTQGISDDTDREAARVLRAATTKHRVKRRTKRIYERTWFQAIAIAALLLAVGAVVYLALQPPGADKLFAKAQRLMASSDPDERRLAREDPIEKYLLYYPTRDDDQAKQIHSWADEVDLDQRERQLRNRMRMKMSPDGEAETVAQGATHLEETGDLQAAADRWGKLLRFKDAQDPGERPWGLLAEKRLQEFKEVTLREGALQKRVTDLRGFHQKPTPAKDSDVPVELAIRAEQFGDMALSLDLWEKLKEKYRVDFDVRPRFLLASKRVYELKDKAPRGPEAKASRVTLLRDKLVEAEKHLGDRPRETAETCYDVVALYDNPSFSELSDAVTAARKLLRDLPADLTRGLPPLPVQGPQ
jgi:eukaryotic-like serine/threonine-protein kinase